MKVIEKGHITDLALEDYSLDHLAEPELEAVEEHILICPTCQDRLQEIDDFVRAFRMAHQELEAAEKGQGGTRILSLGDDFFVSPAAPLFAPAQAWFQKPAVWAFAAAFGLLVLAVVPLVRNQSQSAPASVQTIPVISLVAQRGGEGVAQAPAGQLALQLDLRGVNEDPLVVEITSWDGKPVWKRTVGLAEAVQRVRPEISFAPGQYWVRVQAQDDGTLLREFGLKVAD